MTDAELDALQALAQQAKITHPDKWVAPCDGLFTGFSVRAEAPGMSEWVADTGSLESGLYTARFIAAANPETALTLIARIRELQAEVERRGAATNRCKSCQSTISRRLRRLGLRGV